MTDTNSPLNKLLPVILEAVMEWQTKNTPEVIKAGVIKRLNAASSEITMKLLGFNTKYGGDWEIDHCNGRSGNSLAGDRLMRNQKAAIEEWLSMFETPTLSPAAIKRLNKSARDDYESNLYSAVRSAMHLRATRDAEKIVNSLAETDISKYIQAINLLNLPD